ncbi:hypothetical protein NSTC745_06344 [Nostoc sp. DSM 114161]|jgi:hypothetical protein|uniref:hypothetical protein n=1 Tax=Nostoc sp. DSM 114161 TaxID=3440143 RepID=UPI004045FD54
MIKQMRTQKDALVLGIIELFKCFRLSPEQAYKVLDEVRESIAKSVEKQTDNSECQAREAILTISFSPNSLVEVLSQVSTKATPLIRD